jgi:hypothetical protein
MCWEAPTLTDPDKPFNKFRWNDHPTRVGLKGTANALATVMFNKANMDGTNVYGSQENLAKMLRVSTKTVGRAQRELESLGLVRRTETGSGFGRRSNGFVLTMPPAISDISSPHVASISDTFSIPDIDVPHIGHPCPLISDMGVPPIDPLPDPGNKPGSREVGEADISDDRPVDPFGGADDQQESEPGQPVSSSSSSPKAAPPLASQPPSVSSARGQIRHSSPMEGEPTMSQHDPFAPDPFASTSSPSWSDHDPEPERKPTETELFDAAKANLLAALEHGHVELPKAWSAASTTQPMVQDVIAHLMDAGLITDYQPEWGPAQLWLAGRAPSRPTVPAPDPSDPFATPWYVVTQ